MKAFKLSDRMRADAGAVWCGQNAVCWTVDADGEPVGGPYRNRAKPENFNKALERAAARARLIAASVNFLLEQADNGNAAAAQAIRAASLEEPK